MTPATPLLIGVLPALAQTASNAATAAAPAAAGGGTTWLAAGFILLALGVAIAVLEMFVPSGGVLSIAAVGALIGSIACFFAFDTTAGFVAMAVYAAGAPVAIVLGLKVWQHTPLAKSMVLGNAAAEEDEVRGGSSEGAAQAAALVGQTGVAITPLRPVGFVRLGRERIEAQAETDMIDPGTRVTIVECEGARIVVRPVAE